MGYHVVDLDSVSPHPEHESDRRSIQNAVDLEHVGLSVYTAEPGEQIPQAYHYHDRQEELLYVVDGELHVETPKREYVVGRNSVFVAKPDAPHRGFNHEAASETLRVVAVGGPVVDDGHDYTPGGDG